MVSGAGHDAMILAERVPTTMIFLRSPGGISHHPDESVRPQDVENALTAGRAFLRHLTKAASKEQSV
jgi:allantoate deiminase